MSEIMTIASSTWQRILRMKSVYFLILCVLILIASAYNYSVLSLDCHRELMVDVALLLNTIAAVITAISISFEIPKELREGVASTLLSKPLGRTQYLVGKLVGMIVAGLVITGLITIGYLFVFNSFFNDVNVAMFQAQLLVMASVIPMCAIALLISVLIPENLAPLFTAVAIWFSFSVTKLSNLQYVYGGILPDLNLYNIRAEASYGVPVAWSYFSLVILWGLVFAVFSTSIASMIFGQKDLK